MKYIILILVLSINILNAKDNINIFTCEPEWALLAKEITQNKANITSGIYAKQNPHFIQAKPSLISNVKNANLLLCTGADLEIGWLPMLLEKSGNKGVSTLYLYNYVDMLDVLKPEEIDRKNGDVHAQGNPHIHLNPYNMLKIAFAIKEQLVKIDANNADFYNQNYDIFIKKFKNDIAKWEEKSKKIQNVNLVFHHKDFDYLAQWLKLNIVAYLEEKPGVEPSAKYLSSVVNKIKPLDVKLIVRAPYSSSSASIWVSEKTNINALELPYSLDFNEKNTIFDLYDNIINQLINEIK